MYIIAKIEVLLPVSKGDCRVSAGPRALLLVLKVAIVPCFGGEITEVIEKDTTESALLSRKLGSDSEYRAQHMLNTQKQVNKSME